MAEGKKLEQAKKALALLPENLNDGRPLRGGPLLDRDRAAVREARRRRPRRTGSGPRSSSRGLKPIGGTAIEEALVPALEPLQASAGSGPPVRRRLPDRRQADGRLDERRRDRRRRCRRAMGDRPVRVFSFGIGTDVNTHLLDRLTETTRARQPVRPAGGGPRAQGLELLREDQPARPREPEARGSRGRSRLTKLAPPQLPDLFRGEQLVVLGRYIGLGRRRDHAGGNGERRSRGSFTYEASFPARATGARLRPAPLGDAADRLPPRPDPAPRRERASCATR